ncbi:DinB superfamily protein [Ruminiclostridium hungatei]|uniref:DinB superfamily protein n=1 Tax=Ruminiclostridium hungatei TaxID=48256 RepID=A0A1V4SEN7_RUMHU|nr:DinB family protein [Ruminiclostridium hungatei]OPX41925.1 DinB superfamily protein [Ruminiclostridium hungatei]
MNYREVIYNFHKFLLSIDSEIAHIKISEEKWSLREIVGHLIDSAANNHHRLVRLQFTTRLDFPAYEAEQWISAQKYNNMDWELLVSLWYSYNCMLINIIDSIEGDQLDNVWLKGEEEIPLREIIHQYYRHLELHMEHFNSRLGELLQ